MTSRRHMRLDVPIFMTLALIHVVAKQPHLEKSHKVYFWIRSCMTKKRHKDSPIAGNAEVLLYLVISN